MAGRRERPGEDRQAADISGDQHKDGRIVRLANHERIAGRRPRVEPYGFGLQERAGRVDAVFTADAGVLAAAKGRHETDGTIGVDPDRTGLQSLRHAEGAADNAGTDRRR